MAPQLALRVGQIITQYLRRSCSRRLSSRSSHLQQKGHVNQFYQRKMEEVILIKTIYSLKVEEKVTCPQHQLAFKSMQNYFTLL